MAPVAPLFTPYRPTRTRQESHAPSLNGDRQSRTAPGDKAQHDKTQNMAAIGFGEKCTPQAPALNCECLPEPVKSAYGVAARWAPPTPDRTRPTGYPHPEVGRRRRSGLQFGLQFTTARCCPRRTDQGQRARLNRSGRPRPKLVMRLHTLRGLVRADCCHTAIQQVDRPGT
jgi:hypothetical protein